MSSQAASSEAPFDLDEDLFDFQAVSDAVAAEDDNEDLERVFAQFEEEEAARQEAHSQGEHEGSDALESDELPATEGFADSSPNPPPAIPRQPKSAGPHPLRAPSAEELAAQRTARHGLAHDAPVPSVAPDQRAVPVLQARAPTAIATGWKTAAGLLIAITSVNALVAMVALRSTGELRRSVETVGSQVSQTATELMRESLRAAPNRASGASAAGDPESTPNAAGHPTFELAREDIQRGEFARARRRLYALLAIVDRLDPLAREEVEARANFLLAQALHMEGVQRWEVQR